MCGIAAASNSSVRGLFEKSIGVLPFLYNGHPGIPPKYSRYLEILLQEYREGRKAL